MQDYYEQNDNFDMDESMDDIEHLLLEKVFVQRLPNYAGPEGQSLLVRATEQSAGVELYATQDVILLPGEQAVIPTGLRMALPNDMEFQVRSKSGRSAKERLQVSNSPGTVDGDYRGEVGVIVQNCNPVLTLDDLSFILGMIRTYVWAQVDTDIANYNALQMESDTRMVNNAFYDCCPVEERTVTIKRGQKLAQGVFAYYASPQVVEVKELDETTRGEGGFGSTGL
jgi:dUTP pyrophosphatase